MGAVTIWSSARRFSFHRPRFEGRERAEKLVVVKGEQRYELRGAVEVLSGSRIVFPGVRAEALGRKAFVVRTCLFDGDEVTVAGVATSAAEGKEYRDRGAMVLEPSADAGVIFACAGNAPATVLPRKALFRHFSALPLMLLGCVPLYTFVSDYSDTECTEVCKSYGWCNIVSNFQARGWRAGLDELRKGEHLTCAATSDAGCRESSYCKDFGRCTAGASGCIASSADDCRQTMACLASGWCSPLHGDCRAVTVEDCRHTEGCVDWGLCAPEGGSCQQATNESCRATVGCADDGVCGAINGTCAATRSEDCAATELCLILGHCTAVDGRCALTSDADCRRTSSCQEFGKCSFADGYCVARNAEDCRDTRSCGELRKCAPKDGVCVEDGATCRDSAACKHWGRCEGDHFCLAGDANKTDCSKATVCQGKADCRPLAGSCVSSCQETEFCRRSGGCTQKGESECVVGSDADCAATATCRALGFCSVENGICALTSDSDCARTRHCKRDGRCSLVDGGCSASDTACESTPGCKLLGRCSVKGFECVAKTEADCAKSEVCAKFGWCTPVQGEGRAEQCGPLRR